MSTACSWGEQRGEVVSSRTAELDVVFGALNSEQNPIEGQLADIRFHDDALTALEASALRDIIWQHYNNQPPEAIDDSYAAAEDLALLIKRDSGVLQNDTDAESDPLVATAGNRTAAMGQLTLLLTGSFAYVPDDNFFGSDAFQYRAHDGAGIQRGDCRHRCHGVVRCRRCGSPTNMMRNQMSN